MSLPQERSMAEQVFYTWVVRSRFGSKTILIAVKSLDQDLNSHATSPSSVFSSCTFLTLCAAWRPGRTIALLACGASC